MAQIDIVKEKINYFKVWLGIFVITLIGLLGWISTNYETISNSKLVLSLLAILWLLVSIHFLNKTILEKINSLKDL